MRVFGIIPARLQSSRLPRKLLLSETGQTLLQYTWEQACRAKSLSEVIIATDSPEIATAVKKFGGRVEMTGEQGSHLPTTPGQNDPQRCAHGVTSGSDGSSPEWFRPALAHLTRAGAGRRISDPAAGTLIRGRLGPRGRGVQQQIIVFDALRRRTTPDTH